MSKFPEIVDQCIDPVFLLQQLIRFDTTNPPGNEKECIEYIEYVLNAADIETKIYTEDEQRPNLVAKIPGKGTSAPILLYGHADVVPTEGQDWHYPPFEGKVVGDCIWGRGTLDMKGELAMMISSMLKLKAEGIIPTGDIIFAVVSDEEAGGLGAKYLVEKHSDIFKGVKYAIGEFGGFTMYAGNTKFYPIMVAEKHLCSVQVVFKGIGGHGSIPVKNGAAAKAGKFMSIINKKKLPVHITPVVEAMINKMGENLHPVKGFLLKLLLNKNLTNLIIKLMGESGAVFDAVFHNTINATLISGGTKINVVPEEVTVTLDGRLLPGVAPEEFLEEIKNLAGQDAEVSIINYEKGPTEIDMGLFDTLAGIITEKEPSGIPTQLLITGVTDARHFSKLGIQTYGFTPMLLPKDFNFTQLIHGSDERIPVVALQFGTEAIYTLLNKF